MQPNYLVHLENIETVTPPIISAMVSELASDSSAAEKIEKPTLPCYIFGDVATTRKSSALFWELICDLESHCRTE
jgi:hypothetical protein